MTTTIPPETIAAFHGIATASVADAVEQKGVRGYLTGSIKAVLPGKLVGPAVTVQEVPSHVSEPPRTRCVPSTSRRRAASSASPRAAPTSRCGAA